MADIDSNLPVSDTSDGSIGAAAPSIAEQIGGRDASNNLRPIKIDTLGGVVIGGEGVAGTPAGGVLSIQGVSGGTSLSTADILNTSAQYRAQSVNTSAAEALGGATILSNRKMLSITPTNGTVYWGFNNSVTTSTGTPIFKNQTVTFAVGSNVHVYVIAASTVDCRIAEGS